MFTVTSQWVVVSNDATTPSHLSLIIQYWVPLTISYPLRVHSEKFKMNRNGNSILSENICDLLLVCNV